MTQIYPTVEETILPTAPAIPYDPPPYMEEPTIPQPCKLNNYVFFFKFLFTLKH